MSWDSGPALPPGTLVLSPEDAAALREAVTDMAEMITSFAAAWAEAAPRLAESLNASLPPLRLVVAHQPPSPTDKGDDHAQIQGIPDHSDESGGSALGTSRGRGPA